MIPYGRQSIDEDDIRAVVDVLRSDWLTTGPKVVEFEQSFAEFVGAKEAVAVNSGTAALHAAMFALKIEPGDEVIVPAITFAATANCVVFQGGTPVFADVNPDTLLIEPEQVESKINSRTRAVVAMDYAGHPADYDRLRNITDKHGIALAADACHALGAEYKNKKVGTLADLNIFSFHPVKHITTGEGGMITTDDTELARKMRIFRNHGITSDHHQREATGSWFYQMVDLGFNYRLSDIQCALGISQLRKLPKWLDRRRQIAQQYNQAFAQISAIRPLHVEDYIIHAYHLYVVQLEDRFTEIDRDKTFSHLRQKGIGVNVHYIPVHLHLFYQKRFGTFPGLCPQAEAAFDQIISLPIFPDMEDRMVNRVIDVIRDLFSVKKE
jgi:perosamine synthetase